MVRAARVRLEIGEARGDRCLVRVARLARMVVAGRCRRGGDVPWKCIEHGRRQLEQEETNLRFLDLLLLEINHVSKHCGVAEHLQQNN